MLTTNTIRFIHSKEGICIQVADAWGKLIDCEEVLGSNLAFQYDLVDVGRQVLSKSATGYWDAVVVAYNSQDKQRLKVCIWGSFINYREVYRQ